MLASLGCCNAGQPEATFELAFGPEALDLTQCKVIENGTESVPSASAVLAALGFKGSGIWKVGRSKDRQQTTTQTMIVLNTPVQIGSMSLSASERWGLKSRTVHYLKADAAAVKMDNEKDWEAFPAGALTDAIALFTFPAGTKTRAVRVTEVRNEGESTIESWRFFKRRLHSLTPTATGIAERGSFCTHASAVIKGQNWRNAALDPDPTAKATKVIRAPVTDISPSFFILHWDQAQTLTGLVLHSNAAQYKVYAYSGDARGNPALAGPNDWTRITFAVEKEIINERDKATPSARWISFPAVKTQAFKLHVLECTPKMTNVFSIATLSALSDIGDAAVPAAVATDTPAYQFKYALTQPGDTALAIKGTDGRRIRTLYSQIERAPGEHTGGWDLKDDQGRMVEPGAYKWEALNAPPLELHYQMTVTPNVETRTQERTPWPQEMSGPHGWLADHAMATTCTTHGDKVYFGAPGVEGGNSFIECDLNGVRQWGKVNFGAWTGVSHLAADGGAIFIHAGNALYRMEQATHQIRDLGPVNTDTRKGWLHSMTAHDGKVYLARSSAVPFIDNAAIDWQVDLENCLPRYPKDVRGTHRTQPNPRVDFLRVLRLTGTPPGQENPPTDKPQDHWPVYLESTQGAARRQFVMISFKEPIAIGSLVFPHPGGKLAIKFSTLRPQAAYPPNAAREADWIPFEQHGKPGWECIAAPRDTLTRALRITFVQPGDEMDDLMDGPGDNPASKPSNDPGVGDLFAAGDDKKDGFAKGQWTGRLEGLRILRRRLQNLFSSAKVRVNSGTVAPDGVWDAKRTESLTPQNPGIYLMEWDAPQNLCGVAFREIDGAKTEIDVWTGAETGAIPLDGTEGWKTVATYKQARRLFYEPDFNRNDHARYMDGHVNFDKEIKTRAMRLRVVEQWLDNGDYPHGLRVDQGGRTLDPRRCRIWGVAPLASIGGERPLDRRVYQGLDVVDAQSGKWRETIDIDPGYSLAVNAAGELCTLRDHGIQKIDTKTGQLITVVKNLKSPERLTTGPDGNYYVYCGHEGGSVVNVFDKDGKAVRVIGHPGGLKPGPWDAQRLSSVNDLCVDKNGGLWVMDIDDQPRRTVQFKTDGTFVQELLGNTHYGGGGTLNRYDMTRGYLGRVEFDIDWAKRTTRIRGMLAEKIHGNDLLPVRIKDRLYLTTAPLSYRAQESVGVVYLYNEATGTARLAAAFGDALHFEPLFQPAIVAAMKGKTPSQFEFMWSDRNGDGKVDLAEVTLEEKDAKKTVRAGRFDHELASVGINALYSVKEFLPDGTPIYQKKTLPHAGTYRMNGGNILALDADSALRKGMENALYSADGKRAWGHPSDHPSVSGLWLPPWSPGYVTNQFAVIGHEVAKSGDLGEYVVVHANNGQWNIWTADGYLAGHILYHVQDRRSHTFGPAASAPGTRMDPLSGGQEHFHGFFTQSEKDGSAHMIAGHNYMSVMEVKGIEKFKRTSGELKVTPEDVQRVRVWESEQTRKEILTAIPVIECRRPATQPRINGKRDENEWPEPSAKIDDISFTMTYDASNLYLSFSGVKLLKNSGAEFQRYFKTGACLDLQIGADPKADPARNQPLAGDSRVLLTFAKDKPQVVLYQPVNAAARPEEAWDAFTAVAGKTHFDRVVLLDKAQLASTTDDYGNLFIEASIPIQDLGLKIVPDLRLKMDWGVLISRDGNQVQTRSYWTNKMANGTSDESFESRLEPHLWGFVHFPSGSPGSKNGPGPDHVEEKGGDILDILER